MKAAVYVSNGLWDKAQAKAQAEEPTAGNNKSKVVQMALEHFVADAGEERPAFARERPAWSADEIARVRKRLLRQARQQYEAGYRVGVALVEQLSWDSLSWLAGLGWDFDEWSRTIRNFNWVEEQYEDNASGRTFRGWVLTDRGRGLLLPSRIHPAMSQSSVYQQGLVEAVRDVWESISGTSGRYFADAAELGPDEDDFQDLSSSDDIIDPDDLPFD